MNRRRGLLLSLLTLLALVAGPTAGAQAASAPTGLTLQTGVGRSALGSALVRPDPLRTAITSRVAAHGYDPIVVATGVAAEDGITIDENAAGHIFKDAPGHLADDTAANRDLLTGTANNPDNYLGTDKYASEWYARTEPNGKQVWVRVQNGSIRSGGVNPSPGTWNPQTGLSRP